MPLFIDYSGLPERLQEGMRNYIERRIPAGDFLMSVISNDLREACCRADNEMRYQLFNIVRWLYNEAPAPCWGSPDNIKEWMKPRA